MDEQWKKNQDCILLIWGTEFSYYCLSSVNEDEDDEEINFPFYREKQCTV